MNLRPRRQEEVDVNITPLIDVVFLLLIFFMVSTSFIKESEIKLDLPQASATQAPEDTETITVSIDAKGRYFVNDKALINQQAETLERAIKDAVADLQNPILVIDGDKAMAYQSFVTVLDVAKKLDYLKVSIATERPSAAD